MPFSLEVTCFYFHFFHLSDTIINLNIEVPKKKDLMRESKHFSYIWEGFFFLGLGVFIATF